MRLKILLAWAAATLVLGGGVASAATGGSTLSSSTFDADTTAAVTGNFDAVTPLPYCSGDSCFNGFNSLTIGTATFTTPNADGQVNVNSAYYNGPSDLSSPYLVNSTYSGSAADIIDISLSSSTTAFALNFNTLFNSTAATFTLSNGYSTVIPNTLTEGNQEFIGFLSSTPFNSIEISVPNDQSIVVANFETATATRISAAPEPAVWLLMGLGLGGVGFALRRAKGGVRFGPQATPA